MPYRHKIYCCFFLTLFSLSTNAAGVDTTAKRSALPLNLLSYNTGDYSIYFKNATKAIGADSLDKGIHLLAIGVNNTFLKQGFAKVSEYRFLEFFNIVQVTDTGKLTKSEKAFGQAFLKMAFTIKEGALPPNIQQYMKQATNTVFNLRLKAYIYSFDDPKKTLVTLKELLAIAPNLTSANLLMADNLYDDRKYEESIVYYTKVIKNSPQYAYAYLRRGKAYVYTNQLEKAVEDDDAAISLFPNYVKAYYDRADAFFDQDKYHEAITGYKKSKSLNPYYEYPNYNISRSYNYLKMADSALYYIDIHTKSHPEDGYGYDVKGDIYYDRNEYTAAIELYTRAIAFEPEKSSFYEDRGNAYFYADKVDEAIRDFEKSAELDKSKAYSLDHIGDCYYKLGEYGKAIPYHLKASKVDPGYKYAYTGLNLSYVKLEKYEEAIKACKKAIAIDSTYALALGNLGWTYYCSGNFDACIEFSYKAIKYENEATYAMFNIALATLRKGDFEKSKELYIHFIATCKEKGYEIRDGAIDDLRDLIKKKITVKEATYIIEHIFEKTP
ncbi:MAG TPA: tetratricopeptide repeat protein [Mucilaginibacter sp.]|nr:tetratricopeptide repeat protein [Mucilaginibacter sp.]